MSLASRCIFMLVLILVSSESSPLPTPADESTGNDLANNSTEKRVSFPRNQHEQVDAARVEGEMEGEREKVEFGNAVILGGMGGWGSGGEGLDYCDTEVFRAECPESHVILIELALYGRMSIGRCVETSMGHVGCYRDVMTLADRRCSGLRYCDVYVPDAEFEKTRPCVKELKSYLRVAYKCLRVANVTGGYSTCRHHSELRVQGQISVVQGQSSSAQDPSQGQSSSSINHAQIIQQNSMMSRNTMSSAQPTSRNVSHDVVASSSSSSRHALRVGSEPRVVTPGVKAQYSRLTPRQEYSHDSAGQESTSPTPREGYDSLTGSTDSTQHTPRVGGYIASLVTSDAPYCARRPWVIDVERGRRVELVMWDFTAPIEDKKRLWTSTSSFSSSSSSLSSSVSSPRVSSTLRAAQNQQRRLSHSPLRFNSSSSFSSLSSSSISSFHFPSSPSTYSSSSSSSFLTPLPSSHIFSTSHIPPPCREYAVVEEGVGEGGEKEGRDSVVGGSRFRLCGSPGEEWLKTGRSSAARYRSRLSSIKIWISAGINPTDLQRFLIQYTAVGCTDPVLNDPDMYFRRSSRDELLATVGCKGLSNVSWTLQCRPPPPSGDVWTWMMSSELNCRNASNATMDLDRSRRLPAVDELVERPELHYVTTTTMADFVLVISVITVTVVGLALALTAYLAVTRQSSISVQSLSTSTILSYNDSKSTRRQLVWCTTSPSRELKQIPVRIRPSCRDDVPRILTSDVKSKPALELPEQASHLKGCYNTCNNTCNNACNKKKCHIYDDIVSTSKQKSSQLNAQECYEAYDAIDELNMNRRKCMPTSGCESENTNLNSFPFHSGISVPSDYDPNKDRSMSTPVINKASYNTTAASTAIGASCTTFAGRKKPVEITRCRPNPSKTHGFRDYSQDGSSSDTKIVVYVEKEAVC